MYNQVIENLELFDCKVCLSEALDSVSVRAEADEYVLNYVVLASY